MLTRLSQAIKDTPEGAEAEGILRSCVHCGFCTATCPTYQLLGDENDGPRGRIYLIQSLLEGNPVGEITQRHLDRCLGCRSCETTCPSGVRYGRLLDISRPMLEARVSRPFRDRVKRWLIRAVLPHRGRFTLLMGMAAWIRPVLPTRLSRQIPRLGTEAVWPQADRPRKMLVLGGCAQQVLEPGINAAAARILGRMGIELMRCEQEVCCGALSYHLAAHDEGLGFMRKNVDAWIPYLDAGAEAIVITASGCGVMVKEYGELLKHDLAYAEKAARVSAAARDIAEVLAGEDLSPWARKPSRRIAFQSPCSLQHGQKLDGLVEDLLGRLGFQLCPVADAHLCCGSAGTYSLLQRSVAGRLLAGKLKTLMAAAPTEIVTANIGCLTHLRTEASVPVRHWIELLDETASG
jgi:glycolate oxidase iron-sulfur subunit